RAASGAKIFASRQSGQNRWKLYTENGAALLSVVAKDLPSVFLHNAETDAKSEPGALANGLGGVKRVENAMRFFDPRARIGKRDCDVGAIAYGFDRQRSAAAV